MKNFLGKTIAVVALLGAVAGQAAAFQIEPQPASPVPPTPQPSLAEIQAKAAQGDAEAEYRLGTMREYRKDDLPCDRLAALDWYRKAADQGFGPAKTVAETTAADYARYLDLKGRAEAGDAQAQYDFAVDIGNDGRCFGETDDMKWIRLSAAQGVAAAEIRMGDYYFDGYKYDLKPRGDRPVWAAGDGDQNLPEAIAWYGKAAEQDDLGAEYVVSGLYALDTPSRDLGRMETWMQRIAYRDGSVYFGPKGDAFSKGKIFLDAQQQLCRYYKGDGMFRPVKAEDYSLMVRLDSQPDYTKLRVCYTQMGAGIDAPDALVALGDLYAEGLGGPVDSDAARDNYEKVVNGTWIGFDQLKPLAMAKLGMLYAAQGDDTNAYFWLKLSTEYRPYNRPANAGKDSPPATVDDFRDMLAKVKGRLTSSVRKQQDAAIAAWLGSHIPMPEIRMPPVY